jgi:MYXO-CTERM domain-containing protein
MLLGRGKSRCKRVRGMLSDYIDGTLVDEDQLCVEQHIETCAGCSRELESLRTTVRMLKRVPVVSVPRSFAITGAEERERAPSAPEGPRRLRPATVLAIAAPENVGWLRPATALATLALVAVLLLDFLPILSTEVSDKGELVAQPPSPAASPVPRPDLGAGEGMDILEQITPEAVPTPLPGEVPMPTGDMLGAQTGLEDSRLVGAHEAAEKADEAEDGWPFRQIEIALGAVALALMAALLLTRRRRKWKGG